MDKRTMNHRHKKLWLDVYDWYETTDVADWHSLASVKYLFMQDDVLAQCYFCEYYRNSKRAGTKRGTGCSECPAAYLGNGNGLSGCYFYWQLDNKINRIRGLVHQLDMLGGEYPMNAIEWRQQITELRQEILDGIIMMASVRIK